jgi:sigma-B regulation protein RsbU (phosphoserine phosphatase)
VTDKGMPAALFMVFARSALRAAVRQDLSPAGAACAANDLICRDSFEGLFATLVYARLDPQSGRLVYVNGGHNPPLFYRARTDEIVPLTRTGLPLGVMEGSPYAEEELQLEPGDFLLFYTDGITEAVDRNQAEFGLERLLQAARSLRALSPAELVAGLEQALTAFADPAQSFDDITMLVVRRSPSSA